MNRFDVAILPEAEAEIRVAFDWYQERDPQAALAFRTIVFNAIDALADSALKWKKEADGTHRVFLQRFPYTVFYEVEQNTVFVLAVAHQRRMPGYWRNR